MFETLVVFVPAALAVVLTPGPDTIYTLTRSLEYGRQAGLAAALGTATGVVLHTAGAVLGLSALLRTSPLAYTGIKYAGAAYLVYLGMQTLRSDKTLEMNQADHPPRRTYRGAVTINLTNPKVAVFVLAFLPQFVSPTASAPAQLSLLGVIYATLSLLYLGVVAWFATHAQEFFDESGRASQVVRMLSGTALVGFGLALLGSRPTG